MKKEGFVKGAVLGGLIGSAAGLLLAPKSGKDLRCDISDAYSNIAEKGHHIKDVIHNGAEDLHGAFFEEETGENSEFVIGSVIGALIGASAAVLLAPKSGKDLRKGLEKTYARVKDTVSDTAEEFRDEVADYAQKGQKAARSTVDAAHSSVDDFLELAHVGLKAWNNLQRRR